MLADFWLLWLYGVQLHAAFNSKAAVNHQMV